MRRPGRRTNVFGIVLEPLDRRRRPPSVAVGQPRIDRTGRAGGQLLPDDRSDQRAVVVTGTQPPPRITEGLGPDLVDQLAHHRVGGAQMLAGRARVDAPIRNSRPLTPARQLPRPRRVWPGTCPASWSPAYSRRP